MAHKSIDVSPRKEKTCEKWNFSPVINMTSDAIPKYYIWLRKDITNV